MKENSIKKNAILNVIYTLSNVIFPLVTFPYVSRILTVTYMGKVTFFSSVASYAIMLASLGITTYGIRETAKVRNDKDKLNLVAKELFLINLIATIIVIVLLISSTLLISKFKDSFQLLLINMLYVFSAPFGVSWLFSGLEKYSYITKRSVIIKSITIALIFLFVKSSNDYILYTIITVSSYVLTYIINYLHSKRYVSFSKVKGINISRHFKSMIIIFASILAINVYTHLDTVMLGFINGDDEVGFYTVAVYVKTALLTLINAISVVLLPRISYYYHNNKKDGINKLLQKSIVIIYMISLPVTIFFMLTAHDCVMILGGKAYIKAITCMKIIMPVLLISSVSNITGNQILIPQGKDACFMKAVVCGAIIDIILNLLLMPKYGCVGAAIATLLAEMSQLSIQLHYSKNSISGNVSYKSIIKITISTIISSIVLIALNMLINYSHIVNMVIYGFAFGIIYLLLLYILKEQVFIDNVDLLLKGVKNERENKTGQ